MFKLRQINPAEEKIYVGILSGVRLEMSPDAWLPPPPFQGGTEIALLPQEPFLVKILWL